VGGFNKWFPWLSGAAAVATLVVSLVVLNTANPEPKQAPLPEAAWRVATKFILTAVTRKDLQQAYALSDPSLRSEVTIKEWRAGRLPVPYSTVAQIRKTNWHNTNYVHPRDALINVIIIPKEKGRAWVAQVGLTKVGHGASAHWLVDDFKLAIFPPNPTPAMACARCGRLARASGSSKSPQRERFAQ